MTTVENLYGEDTATIAATPGNADVKVVAASGASVSLDTSGYRCYDITLTNACALVFATPYSSGLFCQFSLILRQDAAGSHVVTWPATVLWVGGAEPVLAQTASIRHDLKFYTTDGGVTWAGFVVGQDVR